jgi:hypothetical protein
MLCAWCCCLLQEPHKHQVEWLAAQLPEYAWVGKGRCPVVFGIGEEVRRRGHMDFPCKSAHWLLIGVPSSVLLVEWSM